MITYRILSTLARWLLCWTHPWRVEGRENWPDRGGAIICCNHLSNWDPVMLLMFQRRRIAFMAKIELFRFKPLGWLFRHVGVAFPVDRGKGDTSALEAAEQAIQAGELMGIFPEGTRSRDGQLLPFKSGAALIAAKTGATVIPCHISTPSRLFRRVTVRIGQPLTPEQLHLTGDKPELRYATRQMRAAVQALGEEAAE